MESGDLKKPWTNPEVKDYGIFPPPTRAQDGMKMLIDHFLGKDWCTVNPISTEQVNTEAIMQIIERYPSGKLRRICKK